LTRAYLPFLSLRLKVEAGVEGLGEGL